MFKHFFITNNNQCIKRYIVINHSSLGGQCVNLSPSWIMLALPQSSYPLGSISPVFNYLTHYSLRYCYINVILAGQSKTTLMKENTILTVPRLIYNVMNLVTLELLVKRLSMF